MYICLKYNNRQNIMYNVLNVVINVILLMFINVCP